MRISNERLSQLLSDFDTKSEDIPTSTLNAAVHDLADARQEIERLRADYERRERERHNPPDMEEEKQ